MLAPPFTFHALLVLVLLSASHPLEAALVNGSFEEGPDALLSTELQAGSNLLPGWTIEGGTLDYSNERWRAKDRRRSIDINGSNAATISQKIKGLDTNQVYALTFAMGINPESPPDCGDLIIDIGGFRQRFYCAQSGTKADPKWQDRLFTFQPRTPDTTLRIRSLNSGWAGAILDDFKLTTINVSTSSQKEEQVYDATAAFSLLSNPRGPWRYAWTTVELNPVTLLRPESKDSVDDRSWIVNTETSTRISLAPVSKTTGNGRTVGGTPILLTPGTNFSVNRFAVLRFTTPPNSEGTFRIAATARILPSANTNADSHFQILLNGRDVFGRMVKSNSPVDFVEYHTLSDGDELDFIAGPGLRSDGSNATLAVTATIAQLAGSAPRSKH